MSVGFRAVQWNRHKLVYDGVLVAAIALYLALFLMAGPRLFPAHPPVTWEILRIRAFGSLAALMLVAILAIGPAARLDRRALPLLYNRRHLGVATGLVALIHAWLVLGWYHSNGKLPGPVSVLASSAHWSSLTGFPFELPGILALAILLVMAATSHDFWLALLGPPRWKAIHMAVYLAFALVLAHLALGELQSERSPLLPALMLLALGGLTALHLAAAARERSVDRGSAPVDGLVDIGRPETIPEGRARIIVPAGGERIAVFRHGGRLSAVSNLCGHQNGPLGEGRIIDGCITCPWHGFQFRPEDGCAPPPFTDRIATYRLVRQGDRVLVDPAALPAGTRVEPLAIAP